MSPGRRLVAVGVTALAGLLLACSSATAAASLPMAPPICVGIVVDFQGQRTGYGGGSNSYCAKVAAGSSGADVLSARAAALGRPQPRYENGLLCALDGFPSTGCGTPDPHGGGYDYWSHWQRAKGATGWSYAQSGAFDAAPGNGDEEGWSWVQGQSERNAPRPPLIPFDQACPASSRAPTSPPRATNQTGPRPTPETALPGGAPPAGLPTPGSVSSPGRGAGTSAPAPVASAARSGTRTPTLSASRPPAPSASPVPQHLTGSPPSTSQRHTGPGPLLGVGVGAALIAALGGAAWWRARAR